VFNYRRLDSEGKRSETSVVVALEKKMALPIGGFELQDTW